MEGTVTSPRFLEALLVGIRSEIDRVYWNVNQRRWRASGCECPVTDAGIDGLRWTQPVEWDDADCSGEFEFDGVVVSWYKHLGRGMSAAGASLEPAEWVAWFDRVIDACDLFEERHHEIAAADANRAGSADRQCLVCERWFSYPARRCGFDATPLRWRGEGSPAGSPAVRADRTTGDPADTESW